jgi:SPP1 family predicted phage head-tail adaptor
MSFIGAMRHFIEIQQESRSGDGAGGAAVSWTTIATLWAAMEPLRVSESSRGERQESATSYRITVRDGITVTNAMRIVWNGRAFNIRGVRNIDERGRVQEILADEGVAT